MHSEKLIIFISVLLFWTEGQSQEIPACTVAGEFPDPTSCTGYYKCIQVGPELQQYVFGCPRGSYYDQGICVIGQCPTSNSPPPPITIATTATSTEATTVSSGICTMPGIFPDPASCNGYYNCVQVGEELKQYFFNCPIGSYYSDGLCIIGNCPGETNPPIDTTTEAVDDVITSTEIITTISEEVTTIPPSTIPTTTEDIPTATEAIPTTTEAIPTTTEAIPTTIEEIPTTTQPTPTETIPPPQFQCTTVGQFPDAIDCNRYYTCALFNGILYTLPYQCPPATYYNIVNRVCTAGICPR